MILLLGALNLRFKDSKKAFIGGRLGREGSSKAQRGGYEDSFDKTVTEADGANGGGCAVEGCRRCDGANSERQYR